MDTRFLESFFKRFLERRASSDTFHSYKVGEYYPHLIGSCPLKAYFMYTEGPSIGSRGVRYVNAGIIYHDFILEAYREMGYEVEVPFALSVGDGIVVRGRADALGFGHVVEVKTVSRLPAEPYENHKMQVTLYMKAFGVKEAVFHYVNRNDLTSRFFEFHFDRDYYNRALERIRLIHSSVLNKTPPDPSPSFPAECSDCPFRSLCPRYRR